MDIFSDFPPASLENCRQITFGRESAFVTLGRSLDARRRDLFAVTYASMRVPDDFVDEVFLKASTRGIALDPALVDAWLERYLHALIAREPSMLSAHPLVAMTRAIMPRLGVGDRPWRLLIRSLRRDVARRPPADWGEFDLYCEGACVAPAVVFLAILEHGIEGHAPRDFNAIAEDVRPLALYCYLVHLARDLEADLAADRQLTCVPLSALAAPSAGRPSEPAEVARARSELLARAARVETELSARLRVYEARGPAPAAAILRQTHRSYRSTARRLQPAASADARG